MQGRLHSKPRSLPLQEVLRPRRAGEGGVVAMADPAEPPPKGGRVIYCRSFVHPKSKRRIYAKPGKVFRFELPAA